MSRLRRGTFWAAMGAAVSMITVVPSTAEARRGKTPPPPQAWTWSVSGTRTVTTEAVGEGAAAMPSSLPQPFTETLDWSATAGITGVHPDGSMTELVRVHSPGSAMDGRAFGLRRFDDGEVLRVERLEDLADAGLADWDPVLVALSPARPEKVTARTPGTRALQWTARLASGQFLRSNCPAKWTLAGPADEVVGGWLGRPVEHVRYEATCGLNGRADVAGGGPVPLRGKGAVAGAVWWDAETHQILRHDLQIDRTVRSRWVAPAGRVEVIQTQAYTLSATWAPAAEGPRALAPLRTEDFTAVLAPVLAGWTACSPDQRERELVVAAGPSGILEVRDSRFPVAPGTRPDRGAQPGLQLQEGVQAGPSTADLSCWQAAADAVRLPAHDDIGVEFTFVLPWRNGAFGLPGVVDRHRPPPGPLFVLTPEALRTDVAEWLGVPH